MVTSKVLRSPHGGGGGRVVKTTIFGNVIYGRSLSAELNVAQGGCCCLLGFPFRHLALLENGIMQRLAMLGKLAHHPSKSEEKVTGNYQTIGELNSRRPTRLGIISLESLF